MKKKIAFALSIIMTFAAVPMTLTAADTAWSVAYTAEETAVIKSGYREQKVAKITLEELKGDSFGGDITFALTDSEGEILEGVKFSKISVDAANTNLDSLDCYNDENHNTAKGKLSAADHVYFNEDGNEVALTDIKANANKKGKLDVTFELSTDISFEGDVYVSVGSKDAKHTSDDIENGGIVKVAVVKPIVAVEIKSTSSQIGVQRIAVADILISEVDIENRFKKDKKINLFVGQYENGTPANVKLIPLKNDNIVMTGDMKVKIANPTNSSATLTIGKESTDGLSAIEVAGVQVNVDRSIPYGWYELYVSGNALRDNGKAEFINDGLVSAKAVSVTDRRDYFDNSGIVVDKYITVDTLPSLPPLRPYTKVTIFNNETANIIIDGIAAQMYEPTVNINGSLYVPLRFIAYALGARETDIVWNDVTKTASVTFYNRTITWTQDSAIYTLSDGTKATMNNGATAQIINDRLYIPVRGFAEAFNIPVVWDAETQTATYNPAVYK